MVYEWIAELVDRNGRVVDIAFAESEVEVRRKAALFNHPDGAAYDLVVELVSMEEYQ
jgi:hypothetical protein